jgi:hypothetical protein
VPGALIGVWSETFSDIWVPLAEDDAAPADLFCELYRELSKALATPPSIEELADIIDDPLSSRETFEQTLGGDLAGERALVTFVESAQEVLEDIGGDPLANRYFNLLAAFVNKFSLRYDLRRPALLCPTLPGIFDSLVGDLRTFTDSDPNLNSRMKAYEEALRDLRYGCTSSRIETCIGKQIMLLEALSAGSLGVTGGTLADHCDQLTSWPHAAARDSLKKLYGFTSDYSGIRHGSNPVGRLREIDMRDLLAISILLAGFTPYLTDEIDAEVIYRRK